MEFFEAFKHGVFGVLKIFKNTKKQSFFVSFDFDAVGNPSKSTISGQQIKDLFVTFPRSRTLLKFSEF